METENGTQMQEIAGQDLAFINDMIDWVYLELWKRKTRGNVLSEEYFQNFPIKRFNIVHIYNSILKEGKLSENSGRRISAILSDLKFLFYFLGNVTDYFYVGTAMVVGNSKYEEVGLNTLSILQGNHYRVYIISVTYERILDLLELVEFDNITDPKNDKWGKKFNKLCQQGKHKIISPEEHEKMIAFKNSIRTSEIHKLSNVFRQLAKEKWDHFHEEQTLIQTLLLRISDEFK